MSFLSQKTHTFQDLLTERVCVCVCPLVVSFKIIRRFVPIVLVPMASLLGSLGSPCSLSHDDLHHIYTHTQTLTTRILFIHIVPHNTAPAEFNKNISFITNLKKTLPCVYEPGEKEEMLNPDVSLRQKKKKF